MKNEKKFQIMNRTNASLTFSNLLLNLSQKEEKFQTLKLNNLIIFCDREVKLYVNTNV